MQLNKQNISPGRVPYLEKNLAEAFRTFPQFLRVFSRLSSFLAFHKNPQRRRE
jgi:hypothetical protein